jgi:hypothetical protein
MTCACDCPCHADRATIIHKGYVEPPKPPAPKTHTYEPGDVIILLKSQYTGTYPQEGKHFGIVTSTYGDHPEYGKVQSGVYVTWIGWSSQTFQHLTEIRPATPDEIAEMKKQRGAWSGAKK